MERTKEDMQTFFDECTRRIAVQGYVAYDPKANCCLYTSEAGNKCAIGIMLTDEESQMVGGFIGSVAQLKKDICFADKLPTIDGYDPEFLHYTQALHDKSNHENWDTADKDYLYGALSEYIVVSDEQREVWDNLKTLSKEAA